MNREKSDSYLRKENIADIYPLSPMQQGMLFHTLFDPSASTYFEQFCCVLKGSWDFKLLEDVWNHLIDQHPVFRTVFNWKDAAQPVQLVLKKRPIGLVVHDLKGLDSVARQKKIEEFLRSDREDTFDLAKGPLMRLNALELASGKHYFVWSYHHILIDGWCLSLILSDLITAYSALMQGSSLPNLIRPPYKKYIAWLAGRKREEAAGFWAARLEDFDTPTPLPRDYNSTGAELMVNEGTLKLSKDKTLRLETFAREHRVTPGAMIQTAWAILLGRYSGNDDVVFGSVISGRPADLKGAEEMIGLFINSLPVRAGLTSTVEETLRDIQEQSFRIQEYNYSFLPEVKACSSVPHTKNLFDSIVVFENYPLGSLDSFGIGSDEDFGITEIKAIEMTNFDLTLCVFPGDQMELSLAYARDRFKDSTINRILSHLSNILTSMIEDAVRPVSQIDILGAEEERQLLYDFNDTEADYPKDKTIHELFEAQAERTPDNIAVIFEDERLTYGELNGKANQLARLLRAKGVRAETIVGIMAERSIDLITGIIAILKAGGAYLPIDPDFPDDRIRFMLEDSGTEILLTTTGMTAGPEFKREKIYIDAQETFIGDNTNPGNINSPGDMAYIIYTSGTTGKPKGAIIEHNNVVRLMFNDRYLFDFNSEDVWTMFHSCCFDLSVWEMYGALLYGGRLVVISKTTARDPELYLEVLKDKGVTVLNQTPSAFYNLSEEELNQRDRKLDLRYVIFGGESLKPVKLKKWKEKYPDARLINMYGITETTVHVTYKEIGDNEISSNISNIGRPIPTLCAYIMDRNQRLLPIGIPGELCVAGQGVARGYLNRPELTEEKFIENPYRKGERLYRSGDLARLLDNGEMEYLGRIDHQVQIRGFRVEPGEIESRLLMHDVIDEAVLLPREDKEGNNYLCAYIVSRDGYTVSELREYLSESLPDYMIPSHFVQMDSIPLTSNGKVDRNKLPEVGMERPEMSSEYVAPSGELEEALAEAWQETLGVDRVGVYDNFFDLGGDSIISLQVVGRLKKRGYEVRPRDIFERQTISELIPVIGESVIIEAEQVPVTGEAPLTPIQRWFFELGLENENHYNQALMFKSTLPIDENALGQSLQSLVDHHDALRMRFSEGRQENMPAGKDVYLIVKDVRDRVDLEEEANSLLASMDIASGPVFGAGLYRMEGSSYLLLTAHHLVIDGVSWRILLDDLLPAYGTAFSGGEIILPPKTTSYKEWSIRMDEHFSDSDAPDETSYWKDELAGVVMETPIDHDLGLNDAGSAEVVRLELDRKDTQNLLKEAHGAYNTEVNDLLLTALMRALRSWTGSDDVLFDLEGHGREDALDGVDISRTVGWFTTIYPVVFRGGDSVDLGSQIKYVKEKLHTIPNKGFNYGILKYIGEIDLPINNGVSFNYLGQVTFDSGNDLFELERSEMPGIVAGCNRRANLLDIICVVIDSTLSLNFIYSVNRHNRDSIEKFANEFKNELLKIITHCLNPDNFDITPSDFDLLKVDQEELDSIYE